MTELEKKLIEKGVETHFEGEIVFFKVKSLIKHYIWLTLFNDTFKMVKIGKYTFNFVKAENIVFRYAIDRKLYR